MNEVNELLDTHFQAFINETSQYDFFLKLADYVRYVLETDKLAPILAKLAGQETEQYKKLDDYYNKALNELADSKQKLVEIVNKNSLSSALITQALKEIEELESGRTTVSNLPNALSDCLFEIAKSIGQQGKIDLLKIFNNPKPIFHNIYGDFIFSIALTDFNNHHEVVKEQWAMEQWGALAHLTILEASIRFYEPMDNLLIMPQDDKPHWQNLEEAAEKIGLVMEWREVKNNAHNYLYTQRTNSQFPPLWAKLENFKRWTTRLHNYLLKELAKQPNAVSKQDLSFDSGEGILYFKGHNIIIGKTKNNYPHDLLQTIFKEPTKLWNYDEIASDWHDYEYKKEDWKRFYNAAYKINSKVAEKTTIADFLKPTKKTVNISKKYL